ncbi:MAG TPA: hypothetical protein VHP36_09405 [Chitinispirillaceae bacterium]|nr:hypothetical protein [Chitinispirillaceae bacterium]
MNTHAIGKGDAWAQFIKLTREARVRNSGLTSGASKTSVSNSKTASSRPATSPLIINGASYNQSKPDVKRIILGGQFDAYA